MKNYLARKRKRDLSVFVQQAVPIGVMWGCFMVVKNYRLIAGKEMSAIWS